MKAPKVLHKATKHKKNNFHWEKDDRLDRVSYKGSWVTIFHGKLNKKQKIRFEKFMINFKKEHEKMGFKIKVKKSPNGATVQMRDRTKKI